MLLFFPLGNFLDSLSSDRLVWIFQHFALSLGRHGVDFRPILTILFERTVVIQFSSRLSNAARAFSVDLPSIGLTAHVTIPDSDSLSGN